MVSHIINAELQNVLRVVNKTFNKAQKVSEMIEMFLRQLEAQGEIINDQKQLVILKFSTEVMTKFEDYKQHVVAWNIKASREAICLIQ